MTGNPEPARGTSTSLPPTSSFRPWHLFATAAMLAATLAEPELRRSLDELAKSLLAYEPKPISELIGEKLSLIHI